LNQISPPKICQGLLHFARGLLLAYCAVCNCNLPGVSLALLLANLSGADAPGSIPWQNARFLVVTGCAVGASFFVNVYNLFWDCFRKK